VRCEVVAGPPQQKNCDMEQLAQVQGQANPISRVAIPLPQKGEPPKLFIQLPINVSFTVQIKVTTNDKDAGITTPFRRCVPAGCFAEIELKDDLQKKFRGSTEAGKITFKDAADRDVAIPLSFKGFAQAFEALLKQ
jgi:invasion protein IalB